MKANENIQARVEELQGAAAEKTAITIETIAKMFLEDRIAAAKDGYIVTEKIAKLYGIPLEAVPAPTQREGNVITPDFSAVRKSYG